MKRWVVALLALAACTGTITVGPAPEVLTSDEPPPPVSTPDGPQVPPAPVKQCLDAQTEPLFVGMLGERLEQRLEAVDPAYDQVRPMDTKLYWDNRRITLLKTVLFLAGGEKVWIDGAKLTGYESCDVAQVFGLSCSAVERQELIFTAVGTHVLYEIAWKSCLAAMSAAQKTIAVTPDTARTYCQTRQRWAFGREPSTEELEACVSLAVELEAQAIESTLPERWAHVCAAVVISTPSIAY